MLIIDEASLIRLDVFSELHNLIQFEGDSKAVLPTVLAGQNNLMDSLMFRKSRPQVSQVVARGHVESLNGEDTTAYLRHHQLITKTVTVNKAGDCFARAHSCRYCA